MARKYFVRHYLKGFRREKDPTGEIHRLNAMGISSGRKRRKQSPFEFSQAMRPTPEYAEEAPLSVPPTVPEIQPTAPPPQVQTVEEGLGQPSFDMGSLEREEEEVLSKEMPGMQLATPFVPPTSQTPLPVSLAAERSTLAFAAKKNVRLPIWSHSARNR